jgi:preprotein translocase subunit SecG
VLTLGIKMASDPLFVLVILSMAIVAIVLLTGIGGFGRGGEFNKKYANKIMRLRIVAQFFAVILILAFVYFSESGS